MSECMPSHTQAPGSAAVGLIEGPQQHTAHLQHGIWPSDSAILVLVCYFEPPVVRGYRTVSRQPAPAACTKHLHECGHHVISLFGEFRLWIPLNRTADPYCNVPAGPCLRHLLIG